MRIFIAGASAEIARARAAMNAARVLGYAVTFDWTHGYEPQGSDAHLSARDRAHLHARLLTGIGDANVFWLLAPVAQSIGAYVEAHHATRIGVETIVASGRHEDIHRSLYVTAHHEFATDSDVLAFLRGGL